MPCLKNSSVTEKAMLRFYQGTVENTLAVLLYSGVCKVNAAVAAHFQVTAIINAGVAGGMSKEVGLLDLVVSEQAAYHDVAEDILTEFHPWLPTVYFSADPILLAAAHRAAEKMGKPVRFGKMVTGEQFIEDDNRDAINDVYSPLSVDMETASIAHVCHVNKIPFIGVRAITDTADHRGMAILKKTAPLHRNSLKIWCWRFYGNCRGAAPAVPFPLWGFQPHPQKVC